MIIEDKIRINRPQVVDDTIDGETIIVNLRNGNYYSFDKLGVLIWESISCGSGPDELANLLARHTNTDIVLLENLFRDFLAALIREGLVVADDSVSITPDSDSLRVLVAGFKGAIEAPVLNKYADMQDMLLLDPIHDTDEKGWPKGKIEE